MNFVRAPLACLMLLALIPQATPAWSLEIGSLIKRKTPARIPDDLRMDRADAARITAAGYAACLVKGSPRRVKDLLDLPGSGEAFVERAKKLTTLECLYSGHLSMSGQLLRGALFAALYRSDFGREPPAMLETPIDFLAREGAASDSVARGDAVLLQFADCVARKEPVASHALVVSAPIDRQEKAALAVLTPQLGSCMPSGLKVRFSASMLKGVFAEALYREAEQAGLNATQLAGTNR